jgi:spoIIIJ-associated protein
MLERRDQSAAHVALDAAGYREQRRTSLEALARRLAERVRRRRKPVTVNPMSPSDRRAVQHALASESGITVRTVGQGFYRKLMIVPEGTRGGGGKGVA